MSKKILWGLMTLSATLVAFYALGLLTVPSIRPPFVQNLFSKFPNITSIHFAGGAVAIVTGALQFSTSLRRKYLSLHKTIGRFYVGSIIFSGIASLVLAINSVGGGYVQWGFGLMAVFWLVTTIKAYHLIRQGDVKSHERWMMRSYSVTLAGVTLRLYLGLSVVLGVKFLDAYPVLAWLCWVPNLLITEWYLRHKAKAETFPEKLGVGS
ncbi:hypothetical protein CWB99_09550 [Pseudoalteromonas rubra]|uniref:DUF2306 domain-containing protein n=1 Tax=Pseudoalteromonas rubra TaxID=43658 RepID=A0A5S3WM32_9GAMM|nr:DUF2306 domain-containing protein [Pseudoalteromonas rubra]TMP29005.1 hypothetical protein CWB99_09550 [Pseudoalteromonas rubra]TMP29195.1 hypothetical protein CWC00_19825 [Pseudoalteromonas rubra]